MHSREKRTKEKLHIVYIPGLGDRMPWLVWLQKLALRAWVSPSVKCSVFTFGWSGNDKFNDRLDDLNQHIKTKVKVGHEVVLVGSSAGASAALAAYAEHPEKVRAVVLICGKIHDVPAIPEPLLDYNNVFEEALELLPKKLEKLSDDKRDHILSMRTKADPIVPEEDTLIRGAHHFAMPMVGHVVGIAYALITQRSRVLRFARR